MPSSSKCSATNEPTAIVSEISKANNITINDNGINKFTTKIPTHRFYGDRSAPSSSSSEQLATQFKAEQTDSKNLTSKQNANCCNSSLSNGTTMNRLRDIRMDDEVLVRFDVEHFYLGIVKEIRDGLFLTRFEDGTEKLAKPNEIKKLNVKTVEGSMCVVCKEYDENVQICSQCQRGYHKKCIKLSKSDECSTTWHCHKCSNNLTDSNEQPAQAETITKAQNQEGCYCQEKGEWFMQMLQCARCLQWYHAKCVKCLNFPLYFGDR